MGRGQGSAAVRRGREPAAECRDDWRCRLPGVIRPEAREARSPMLFDLTLVARSTRSSPPPEVYYLVPDPRPASSSAWRTLAGFGVVVAAGMGVGLLLARLLV